MTRWIATLCLFLILTACAPPDGADVAAGVAVPSRTPAPLTATMLPTASPAPTATSSPTSLPPTATETPTLVPVTVCSPLAGYALEELPSITSQPFIAPRPGVDDGHHGIDLAHYLYRDKTTIAGAGIQAILPGLVAASIEDSWPYGNFVIVETLLDGELVNQSTNQPANQSLYHLYAHQEAPSILRLGDYVECGELIGLVGNTGRSGNYHLHLETRFGPPGVTFASMAYYETTTTEEERANYERWRFLGEFVPFDPMRILAVGD